MAEIPALSRRDFLSTGAKLGAVVAAAPQRHPVTYRDTVPAGFPDETQLPVEGGGTFRLRAGRIGEGLALGDEFFKIRIFRSEEHTV